METYHHYMTVAEAFEYDELMQLVKSSREYVETLLLQTIPASDEDLFAELYADEKLWHERKVDPDRLKQNQRSYVMRGVIWRLRDYAVKLQFEAHPLSLSDRSSIRRRQSSQSETDRDIMRQIENQLDHDHEDCEAIADDADSSVLAEQSRMHHLLWKHTPMIWQIMVVAGLAEDEGIASRSFSDIKKAVRNKLAMSYERKGQTPPEIRPSHIAQHLKLEVRHFCELTGRDFDQAWKLTKVAMDSIRGTRGPYRKRQTSSK